MQRRLFLWGLVVFWVAVAPGMAWALTLEVNSSRPSCQLQITQINNLTWDGAGSPGGQCDGAYSGEDRAISGGSSTGVNHVRMHGLSYGDALPTDYPFGPRVIAAFKATGPPGCRQKVDHLGGHTDLANRPGGWLAVTVEPPDSTSLIFPGSLDKHGMDFSASIDNLVDNGRAWPIPGGRFWLLASGLLGLAGLSQKFISGLCTSLTYLPGVVLCSAKNFIGGNRFNGVKAKSP